MLLVAAVASVDASERPSLSRICGVTTRPDVLHRWSSLVLEHYDDAKRSRDGFIRHRNLTGHQARSYAFRLGEGLALSIVAGVNIVFFFTG